MTVNVTKELIRCSICNNVVPKQRYCPKCGKLLIKTMKNSTSDEEDNLKKKPLTKSDEKIETTPIQQLENLRQKNRKTEDERKAIVGSEASNEDMLIGVEKEGGVIESDETMVKTSYHKDFVTNDVEMVEESKPISIILENPEFTPDKYTMEMVQKIAKNVKYEAYLVSLLKEGEVNEETFLGLYRNIADDTHKLIERRGEIIADIEKSIKGNRSTIASAQQGMKLLNIRKSIDDASEEEYKVKAAALNWDIDNYTVKIDEEERKASYLKNLGSLIDSDELDSLTNDIEDALNTSSKLKINDGIKNEIQNSMHEAISLLKESNGSTLKD